MGTIHLHFPLLLGGVASHASPKQVAEICQWWSKCQTEEIHLFQEDMHREIVHFVMFDYQTLNGVLPYTKKYDIHHTGWLKPKNWPILKAWNLALLEAWSWMKVCENKVGP